LPIGQEYKGQLADCPKQLSVSQVLRASVPLGKSERHKRAVQKTPLLEEMEDAAKDREKSKEEKNVQPKKLNTFL
jgi:hypothetical protein